jgi:hypothetical protein
MPRLPVLALFAMVLGVACSEPTHVNDTPVSLTLSPSTSTLDAGKTLQLAAAVMNSDAQPLTAQAVVYTSSAPSIASVSTSGLVTSVGPTGTATITAILGALSASASVTVTPGAAARVTKVGTDPATVGATTSFGDSIRVLVSDAFGNLKPGAAVAFAVTAGGGTVTPPSAVTDANGRAAAKFMTGSAVGVANTATATVSGVTPVAFTTTTTALIRNLTMKTYATFVSTQPIAALDNADNVTVSQFTSSGQAKAAFTQSAWVDKRRGTDFRVFYGTSDVASKLVDTKTGEQVVIVARDARTDYLVYDRTGAYVTGIAVLFANGKVSLAKILNNPPFAGQLQASSDKVSFAAVAQTSSGLGPLVDAPAAFSTFFNQTLNKAANAAPLARAGALAQAAATATSADALRRTLTQAGIFLVATGVALPALGIVTGALPLALFAGGLGAIAIGNVKNFHVDALNQFETTMAAAFDDGVSSDQSPDETVQSANASLSSTGSILIKGLGNLVTKAGNAFADVLTPFVSSGSVRTAIGGPPAGSAPLDGFGVDQNNTLYPLTGTVSSTGQLSATGSGSGGRTLSLNGTVRGSNFSGSFGGSPGSGSLFGTVSPLANCQSITESGGQGTFTQGYNMGASSGTVSFTYDAFTIPDAFQVMTGGSTVFTTGGLVSGSSSASFQLKGSPIVFVAVTAPLSGTAWEFTLGCP